jgi:RecJ-like exonuclease
MKCPDCDNDADVIDPQICHRCNCFGYLCDTCGEATNDFHAHICEACQEEALDLN